MSVSTDCCLSPFKLGAPVIAPSGVPGAFDRLGVDCPQPFRHNGKVYMLYIGFSGEGYQTALAVAEDDSLLRWKSLGTVLTKGEPGTWDQVGRAGNCVLCENGLYGAREAVRINGRYWMSYHAYPAVGYEAGAAEIGLAWTEDEELLDWHCLERPVLSWRDGAAWERGGLYKSHILLHDGRFWMFYNAKNVTDGSWREQTGAAVSDDLLRWTRLPGPVLPVTEGAWDSVFASDPVVLFDAARDRWVMYYFGFNGKNAMDGIAFSDDLLRWTKHPEPILRSGAPGEIDSRHAHKPGILAHNGALYHFYCACRPTQTEEERRLLGGEYRCITVARSVPW